MNQPLVYLAGPLFSHQDREMLISIEKAFAASGISCFLPHREVGDLAVMRADLGEEMARQRIFRSDLDGVIRSSVLCGLLDGPDVDSGTAAEMGFAHALGKPVFGLCTDEIRRGRTINNMVWGVCAGGSRIHHTIDELVSNVAKLLMTRRPGDRDLADGKLMSAYRLSS